MIALNFLHSVLKRKTFGELKTKLWERTKLWSNRRFCVSVDIYAFLLLYIALTLVNNALNSFLCTICEMEILEQCFLRHLYSSCMRANQKKLWSRTKDISLSAALCCFPFCSVTVLIPSVAQNLICDSQTKVWIFKDVSNGVFVSALTHLQTCTDL